MKLRTLLCHAAFVLSASAAFSQAIDLQQRWTAGKQYFFTIQTTQNSVMDLGPQKMEQGVTMSMEMSAAVRPHEDRKRNRLTITHDRLAMEMNMNGQKMGYDSAKPVGPDPLGMGKAIGGMVGKDLKMLTNEKGEIAEIENYDEFVAQIAGAAMPGLDMKQMFTKESLLQTMKQGSLQALPGKPVAPGDSWPFTNEVALPQLGKVAIKGTYTFKRLVERAGVRCAEILMDGALNMEMSGTGIPGMAALGMAVTGGTISGTVWFDPALGMAREAQLTQQMTMSMKNPADPAATITVPMTQEMTTKLTKVGDLK